MEGKKTAIFAIMVFSIFVFLVTVLVVVYALSSKGQEVPAILNLFLAYHLQLMIVMGGFGVLSGLALYKMLSTKIEKQEKAVKGNLEIIMKFLAEDEREVIRLLMEKEGMTTQSEISKLPGMTRLKAHRVTKKLEEHGIIFVEKHGKINLIRLVEELKGMETKEK